MKFSTQNKFKRCLAFLLTVALVMNLAGSAFAAEGLAPVYDESYYATLDYYGSLQDSSVVKSYHTNGNATITDYGLYKEVVNLTDDRTPVIDGDLVTFDFGSDVPDRFYFEGKTDQPFLDLPWTFQLSYRLNGVPTLAEDLAGQTGLVEVDLDIYPNPEASEYNQNNLVLTAATAFNADDILSLEAPGAEVQIVGNLRTVLFMVLPGEEQHFTIRVGSEDFSFPGLALLAVPATLAQLDQIADLREAKEKVEDSYQATNDSLDVILNTLDGMSGSLHTAANGLDELNSARGVIAAGKGKVYDSADGALADLDGIANALTPVDGHLDTASQALSDTTATLTALTTNTMDLKPELESARQSIQNLKDDITTLRNLHDSLKDYHEDAVKLSGHLQDHMETVNDRAADLEDSLAQLKKTLSNLAGLEDVEEATYQGMTVTEIRDTVKKGKNLYEMACRDPKYTQASDPQAELQNFAAYLITKVGMQQEQAGKLAALYFASLDPGFEEQLSQLDTANELIGGVNGKIGEINSLIGGLAKPTAGLIGDLQNLTNALGKNGLGKDLLQLAAMADDILRELHYYEDDALAALDHLEELADLATRVSEQANKTLDLIQALDDTINAYEPQAQQALADAKTLTGAATSGIRNTHTFLSSVEALLQQSGGKLDSGSQQTLSGLSSTLRKSTTGLEQTGTIRNAKKTVSDLIDDQWDTHTGNSDNLLLMDAGAQPLSLTSQQNEPPASVQYIMRTQEIKVQEAEPATAALADQSGNSSFWGRVKDMFTGIWHSITGIFHRK